jgi:hypothetical protein
MPDNELLDKVEKSIAELEAIDPNDSLAYETALFAYTKIKQIPIYLTVVPKGEPVFRTRTHNTDNYFENIVEIKNPPAELIKNGKNESLLSRLSS